MITSWQSPSNIALIKYWGKRHPQLPSNPSISFTLSECNTKTQVNFAQGSGVSISLDGVNQPTFIPKIEEFIKRISPRHPWLSSYSLSIETSNSFPHSSGIASSASGLSALSLCIVEFAEKIDFQYGATGFHQEASILSRLGSGSASRSIYGGLVVWGKTPSIENANDEYAVKYPHQVHPTFNNYFDVVLLVDIGEKAISSSIGHSLMDTHPFKEKRFSQAHQNLCDIQGPLRTGDLERFIEIVELEALTLHGLMMSSSPSYILLKPNTLAIIQKIREFRIDTGLPISFTLDAGANVHVLFPSSIKEKAMHFIKDSLTQHCKSHRYILDHVGDGPKRLPNFVE
ncbi:MAG: Uncharacterised protein [Owenweeksia sp. TMED14]|nr:MAG: Uncharacterised protein [Owenweeksia sp. TMED14]